MADKINKKESKVKVGFASINRYVVEYIPENVSKEITNKDFSIWGNDNRYPEFLAGIVEKCSTLNSIINGITDYVMGDSINVTDETRNEIELAVKDYITYGVCYFNVLYNGFGNLASIKTLDAKNVRSNKDNSVFFYSEDWNKSYGRVQCISLPKYQEGVVTKSSVLMVKNNSRETYPTPIWNTAIESCLTDIEINHFHYNEVKNGFNASVIINFNNGVPTDEEKDEIEKQINQKFCGAENASRFLLAFNSNKENAVTIEKLNTDDYDERYNSLAKKVRQDIFTTFRANPNLFGIATENLGFSSEEYESSFKLFNKTMIQPIQRKMVGALQPLMNIQIKPFTLNNNE